MPILAPEPFSTPASVPPMEILDALYAWLGALPALAVYVAVFAISYGENVVPPIPGDVAIVVVGMIAAAGAVSLPVVLVLASVASALGFLTVYAAGRKMGDAVLDPDRYRWLPKDDIRRAARLADRHGAWVVLVNRFLPGLRSVIGLAVGLSHMPTARVAALAAVSSVAWTSLIVGLGYALADNRAVIARVLGAFEKTGGLLLALLAAALLVWIVRRRRVARVP